MLVDGQASAFGASGQCGSCSRGEAVSLCEDDECATSNSAMCHCGIINAADVLPLGTCATESCVVVVCDECVDLSTGMCMRCAVKAPRCKECANPVRFVGTYCLACVRTCIGCRFVADELVGCVECRSCDVCVGKRPADTSHVCPDSICDDTMCPGCGFHTSDLQQGPGPAAPMCVACRYTVKNGSMSAVLHNHPRFRGAELDFGAYLNRVYFFAKFIGTCHPAKFGEVQSYATPLPPLVVDHLQRRMD